MKSKIIIGAALAGATVLGALAVSIGSAQQSHPETINGVDRAAVEQIVRDYLNDNPEVIIEALNNYAELHAQKAASDALPKLLDKKTGAEAGKNVAAAKIAVIELFDYHCAFCKRGSNFVKTLTKKDSDIKVVFRDLPILRKESDLAARFALASREQGKYADFHFALLNSTGVLTEDRIISIAKNVGLDIDALKKAEKSPALEDALKENRKIAQSLNLDGTPSFIVATLDGKFIKVIPGYRPNDVGDAIKAAKKAS